MRFIVLRLYLNLYPAKEARELARSALCGIVGGNPRPLHCQPGGPANRSVRGNTELGPDGPTSFLNTSGSIVSAFMQQIIHVI